MHSVCLSDCLSVHLSVCTLSSHRKYYSNVLKFTYAIHIRYSMDCFENYIHTTNGSSAETHKPFLMLYTLWGKMFKAHFNIFRLLLHFGTRAYLFSPDEGSCYSFRPETIVASFLHSMVLIPKVLFNHF